MKLVAILMNGPNADKIAYDFRLKAWLVEANDFNFYQIREFSLAG